MITHKILYVHCGENAGTAKSPYAVWENQVDLSEQQVCCRSYDDNGLCLVNKYAVGDVELPDWLKPQEWIRNELYFRHAFNIAGKDAPESLIRWFVYGGISEECMTAVVTLLKTKKFRNPFRQSLRDQIVAWLALPADDRKYNSPLSQKQWNALLYVRGLPSRNYC